MLWLVDSSLDEAATFVFISCPNYLWIATRPGLGAFELPNESILGSRVAVARFPNIGPVREGQIWQDYSYHFGFIYQKLKESTQARTVLENTIRIDPRPICANEARSRAGMKDLTFSVHSRLTYWLPAILAAILISILSTHYFAAEHTSRIIIPALHWLFPWASNQWLHIMHVGIRKMAHVTEFGVFSVLVFRGVRGGQTGWRLSWALTTLGIAATYAGLDEWHQSFVRLRQSSPRDAAIDILGAVLAQSIVWWYAKQK